jgi:hypothetical protein
VCHFAAQLCHAGRQHVDHNTVDQTYNRDCVIVADLSNDATYAETLFETFGWRVIGVQIGRSDDGMTCEARPVPHGHIYVYKLAAPICSNSFAPNCKTIASAFLLARKPNAPVSNLRSSQSTVRAASSTNAHPGCMVDRSDSGL